MPAIEQPFARTVLGLALLLAGIAVGLRAVPTSSVAIGGLADVVAWAVSTWATHKYIHKYPQRYVTYVLASHGRAVLVHAAVLAAIGAVIRAVGAPVEIQWQILAGFALADLLVSLLRRRDPSSAEKDIDALVAEWKGDGSQPFERLEVVDREAVLEALKAVDDHGPIAELVSTHLPIAAGGDGRLHVVGDITDGAVIEGRTAMLVGTIRMNDVRHLNAFLAQCAVHVVNGGYVALRYEPVEDVLRQLRARHSGLRYYLAYGFHFFWSRALPKIPRLAALYFNPLLSLDRLYVAMVGRRNRALARAEMWGRLAFWGFDVLGERQAGPEVVLLARAGRQPIQNRIPSYFAIVGLEKIGLDGKSLRLHKVRSMFPFSEFLQKRVFEENGLAPSGKFANDFRLTEFGPRLRRYWIDELPQLWDWLRGDIKLVGIRATSRHFLTLYPPDFIQLYLQVKPGLIPPVFDESITTLQQIIQTEHDYLRRYVQHPALTDLKYLVGTSRDILLRGVRSK